MFGHCCCTRDALGSNSASAEAASVNLILSFLRPQRAEQVNKRTQLPVSQEELLPSRIVHLDGLPCEVKSSLSLKIVKLGLAGGAPLVERCPVPLRVAGSSPSQDTYLGCGYDGLFYITSMVGVRWG